MFKIAKTREEKLENILYWEKVRIIAQNIRDEHDRVFEDAYHAKFMARLKLNERPDFIEPLNFRYNKNTIPKNNLN